MSRFHFRLEPVLQQRASKEASAEQALALANQEFCRCKSLLEDTRQQLDATCQQALEGCQVNVFEVLHVTHYRNSLRGKIHRQEKVFDEASHAVDSRRNEAVQARQERQMVEKIKDVHLQAYKREEASREQKEIDELALYAHLRRSKQ